MKKYKKIFCDILKVYKIYRKDYIKKILNIKSLYMYNNKITMKSNLLNYAFIINV